MAPGEYVIGASAGTGGTGTPARTITADEVRRAKDQLTSGVQLRRPHDSRQGMATVYGSMFHPSSPSIGGAASISIRAGEERDGIDVRLAPAPSAGVHGIVRGADSRPVAGALLTMFPAAPYVPTPAVHRVGPSVLLSMGGLVNVKTDSDGTFSVLGLVAGGYTLIARDPAGNHWTIARVDVHDQDIRDLAVNLQPGARVSGRIVSQAEVMPRRGLRMRLTGSPGGGVAVSLAPAIVDDQGRFAFGSVPPGEYRLQVDGLPAGWAATRALSNGRDVLDAALSVASGRDINDVDVALTDRPGEITGTFVHADGRPAPDYYVIAFPGDRTYWTPGSRRIRAVRPAADGTFTLSPLPAGAYRIAAVFDVEPDEWFDPSFLEALTQAALEISLSEGERKVQSIRVTDPGRRR